MQHRIPTDEEFRAYDGADCRNLWNRLGDDWNCPGCGRSKREILRWTRRKPKPWKDINEIYMGWMAGLTKHHDYSAPLLSGLGRFKDTIICDQCNSADGRMKRDLRLPDDFSFSPGRNSSTRSANGAWCGKSIKNFLTRVPSIHD